MHKEDWWIWIAFLFCQILVFGVLYYVVKLTQKRAIIKGSTDIPGKEQTEQRLVSGWEYFKVASQKNMMYTFSISVFCIGSFGVLLPIFVGVGMRDAGLFAILALLIGCPSAILLWYGKRFISEAKQKASDIIPITDRNAHLLPAQETLLRGSDLPPTIQQAELLRAAQAGQETPQVELLRATSGEE